ncbi:DNA-binding transcriptional regulator [uncultured Caulobacter sp.]|uniref:helix-turn-helix domain-containing protein n=1 Tax=uncultured Caulobacter sp. TaxID=158749 RepID=UPI00260C4FD3|nr:helix-turn-helix domain-containing protein [uncultured Caulobacter sp.]
MTPTTADLAIDETAAPSRARSARAFVQAVRWRTGLSQRAFAQAFHIDLDLLRALEQGETRPEAALIAYLRVIDHAPETVVEILDQIPS